MKAILIGIALAVSCTLRSQSLSVYFDFNKYGLDGNAKRTIDSFLAAEHQNLASARIELSGYCDAKGSDEYNDTLSVRRLMAVKEYLETHHPEAGKITAANGFGKRKPLNDNKTEEERGINRRVDINMIKIVLPSLPESKEKFKLPTEAIIPAPKENITLKEKIADTASKAGTNIALKNIYFVSASHRIMSESYPALQELLETMKFYPKLEIEIQGHICCQQDKGDAPDVDTRKHNLSEARARSVYDYLISNGIEANRLTYKGYAFTAPIYPFPEKTEEQRIANRRVEIKIISK
jgi:outer membrane protein OmpA-like peptidoglycan-associated protein